MRLGFWGEHKPGKNTMGWSILEKDERSHPHAPQKVDPGDFQLQVGETSFLLGAEGGHICVELYAFNFAPFIHKDLSIFIPKKK